MTRLKYPLDFDTHYSSSSGSKIPYFTGIQVNGVKSVLSAPGAKSVFSGYSSANPLGIALEHVALDTTAYTAEYASVGLDASNVKPAGTRGVHAQRERDGFRAGVRFPGLPAALARRPGRTAGGVRA